MDHGPLLSRLLVGRQRELAYVRERCEDGGATVIVRGAAGLGKSRLIREVTSLARSRGAQVLIGRCSQAGHDVPLRPIREALLAAARSGVKPPPELAPFLPTLARLNPDWGGSEGADTSLLVLGEALLRLCASMAHTRVPTILVVEDLQWADRETLDVVDYIADNVGGLPVLMIATLRDGEGGRGDELAERLIARRTATSVPLPPLTPTEVSEMARSCLQATELSPVMAASLSVRSEGVPFLVEELLATAVASGQDFDRALPASIAGSVTVRLASLPDDVVGLIRHAAVLGRHFDWEVAARAAGIPTDRAPELFRHAVRAQILDAEGPGYRFRHALTRDAVLADLLAGETSRLAAGALDALLTHDPLLAGERVQVAAQLAEQAGRRPQAAQLLFEGARRALAEGSLASAESLAERAGSTGAGLGRDFEGDVDALMLQIWTQAGRPDRAADVGERLLVALSDPGRLFDVRLSLARAAIAAGRWDTADLHVAAARALGNGSAGRSARLEVVAAQTAMGREDADAAAVLAQGALVIAEQADDAVAQCEALEVIGRVERGRDLAAAEAAFTRAHVVARAHDLNVLRIRALHELGTVDMFGTLATHRLETARREALAAGALSTAAVVDLQLAAIHGERMELDEALAAARRCHDASRKFGLSTLAMSLTLEATTHAKAGRRRELDVASAAARATEQDVLNVEVGLWGNAEASYHLHRADIPAAAVALDRSMEWLRQLPHAAFPFPGMWALLRTVLDEGGAEARTEIRSLRADAPMSGLMLDAADAVADGRAGRPLVADTSFARADSGLSRYERGYRRSLMKYLVARPALEDGWGEPVRWLREALAAFEPMGLAHLARDCRAALRAAGAAAPRQGRGDSVVPPALAALGITSRELDVLALVAAGLSNKAIADQLSLSPRTVEKHVERLVMKAHTSRGGLAGLAQSTGVG